MIVSIFHRGKSPRNVAVSSALTLGDVVSHRQRPLASVTHGRSKIACGSREKGGSSAPPCFPASSDRPRNRPIAR